MPGVDAQAGLPLQYRCNPWERPKIVGEAMGLRPLDKETPQGLAVGLFDLGWLPEGTPLPSALALGLKGAAPAQRGGGGDLASSCDLRLCDSPRQ